jgi:FeS assembly SUF system regulator
MIRLTRLADYAVVLMSHMAYHPDELYNAADTAEATGLPMPTVSKILSVMAKGGLLASHRGLNGGFKLARVPAEITVADIVSIVDGPIALTECVDEEAGDCSFELACPARGPWHKINAAVRRALEDVTLADIVTPFGHTAGELQTPAPAKPPLKPEDRAH